MAKLVLILKRVGPVVELQILEQFGLPESKNTGTVLIDHCPEVDGSNIYLRGTSKHLNDATVACVTHDIGYIDRMVKAISDEMFEGQVPVVDGEVYTWQS